MSTNDEAAAFDPGRAPDLDRDGFDEGFVERAALAVIQGGEKAVGHLPTVVAELYAMYRRRDGELDRLRKVEAVARAYVAADPGDIVLSEKVWNDLVAVAGPPS